MTQRSDRAVPVHDGAEENADPAEIVSAPVEASSPRPAADLPEEGAPDALGNEPLAKQPLGWTAGDRQFAMIAGAVLLALLAAHWLRWNLAGRQPLEIERLDARPYAFRLDINRATWVEWMQLDEIGETLARRIVADREEHGPFQSIDDVERVSGIGPKTMEEIRPFLSCADCPADDVASQGIP